MKLRVLGVLNWTSGVMFAIAIYLVFIAAPTERTMGMSQRIFYFHVGSGWVGAAALFVAVFAGIQVLRTNERHWDRLAFSTIQVGLVFISMIIITGSIWARASWDTWWTWSPRLTSAAVMWLVYVAYFMLRNAIEDPDKRARFGAVYSIAGFITVIVTFLSIRLLRDIHPTLFGSGADTDGGGLAPGMILPFFFSLATFTIFGITLVWHRVRLARLADDIEFIRTKLLLHTDSSKRKRG
ncbi:MAG: cytochrome c biogenesis protein CcsA [Anaerolineales bacterium]|nr:cytochrome c biogenesis protein CcsA [Anaerolineales bacterium]